jgi:leucine dehydrogenase
MATDLFTAMKARGHEQVAVFHYPEAGLTALVGIHNTVLGPSLGGLRLRPYATFDEALEDVLRLSEGMTYKSSLAGLDLGGGKACIIADPNIQQGRKEMLLKFAECVESLSGRYITAEDMGITAADISLLRTKTKYAAGQPVNEGGSGDPSPWTARGVFLGMLAACESRWGTKDISGKKVLVEGAGHVGMYLLEDLAKAGAKCIVADISEQSAKKAHDKFGVEVIKPQSVFDVQCDIYAPCAIGQTINPNTIGKLKCEIIAGGANNQLTDSAMYAELDKRKITYCPDFALNAGGVISVYASYLPGGWNETWVKNKVERIADTITKIISESKKRNRFTEVVALELAKERIEHAREAKTQ